MEEMYDPAAARQEYNKRKDVQPGKEAEHQPFAGMAMRPREVKEFKSAIRTEDHVFRPPPPPQ
jgi:hypothetical protein